MAVKTLKRYDRRQKLGSGAMGEVWLATDTLLNRSVAIKELKATEDARPKKFFLSEAQVLASLQHPNITLIYDAVFEEEDNRYFLVMEYVEGKSLDKLLAGWAGAPPLEITLDVAIGVLEALQYAHQKGIVHRDIKPANVMIQDEGVKLTDFGVAGLMSVLTEGSDYVVGTPAYMSPEVILGEATDGRADLYSLGIMLYEIASGGYRAFDYSNLDETFEAHLDADPYPLSDFAPDIPLAFERAVMRLLAKEPDRRYPSTGAVLEIFKSIQARRKFSQSHLQLLDPEAGPLVGRAAELEQMETVWAEVQQSAQPRLLVLRAEAGMGKSRLSAEFLGRSVIDPGFVALAGRCDESGIPYGPYAEILAAIFDRRLTQATISQSQVDQLLDHIPSLGRLLDIRETAQDDDDDATLVAQPAMSGGLWQALGDRLPQSSTADPWQTEWQFFATVLTILTELGPAAILLENALHLDEASAALTRFLVGQGQCPLLIVAACRETGQALPWLDAFSAEEKVILKLPPLAAPALKAHLAHLIGGSVSDDIAALIAERSQGNPFHAEEIARQLIEANELEQDEDGHWRYQPSQELEGPADSFLPKTVLKAFTRRIEKLGPDSREALAVAALIGPGPEFDFELWVSLLEGDSQAETAQKALDEALKKRLVRPVGPDRYTFRPADVAEVLASTLPDSRRQALHARLAEMLQPKQADPILVGHHYEQAGQADEAARYLEAAGARAMAAQALNAGLAYYRRAVTLVESPAAYKMMGDLYRQKGDPTHSIRSLKRALELARQAGDIAGEAQISNSLSFTLWLYDRYKKAYKYAAAVLKMEGSPEAERAVAQSHLGMISWLVGRLDEAESWSQKAVRSLQESDNQASLAEAQHRLGQVYLSQGKLSQAQTTCRHSLELHRRLGDERGEALSLNSLGQVAVEQGRFEEALAYLDQARQLWTKLDRSDRLMAVDANRGRANLYRGRPNEALPLLSKSLHAALRRGKRSAYVLSDIYLLIARASLETGEIERAGAITSDALKLVEGAGNREQIALAQATRAQIYAAQDDFAAAESAYQKALALFEEIGSRSGLLRTRLNYARFLKSQGQTERAASLEEETRRGAADIGLYLST